MSPNNTTKCKGITPKGPKGFNVTKAFKILKARLGKLSYYNAAEGSYSSEANARNHNKSMTKRLVTFMYDHGVTMVEIGDFVTKNAGLFGLSDWCPQELRDIYKATRG